MAGRKDRKMNKEKTKKKEKNKKKKFYANAWHILQFSVKKHFLCWGKVPHYAHYYYRLFTYAVT